MVKYCVHFVCFYIWNVLEQFQVQEHELEVSPVIYQSSRCMPMVLSCLLILKPCINFKGRNQQFFILRFIL